jgi:divinyl chlorophyllide a 8-vinyl-reductase
MTFHPMLDTSSPGHSLAPMRVFVLGATGTVGRATVAALVAQGHHVVCLVRNKSGVHGTWAPQQASQILPGAELRFVDALSAHSMAQDGFRGERFDALVSCLASRTGAPRDAWAIDHQAHVHALKAAQASGVGHMVLLSAICVQKPLLAFQHAKLAFEKCLIESGINYSIVRPTAFFKSLSGQIERVRRGKPFLLFADGQLTACKPISDADLGQYLADCLTLAERHRRILPIGGPGPAITPLQQGQYLFELLGKPPRFKRVPVGLLDAIIATLSVLGKLSSTLADKAELARIGRYYATESMLVWDETTARYDADATPSTGSDTLWQHYQALVSGGQATELGDHSVF